MLKFKLLAAVFAALLLAPAAAEAGDRGKHRGHFARSPKLVLVLPHGPFVFHHPGRAWHPKPKAWHRPAPRLHVWRPGPPPRAHWRGDDRRHWGHDDRRHWGHDDRRRWDRHDDRRRHGHRHRAPGRDWKKEGKRHFAGRRDRD